MLAALSVSAANFVFHGKVSGDMLDVENWYEVSGTPYVWSIPINEKADWTFSAAPRLPTAGDTVGIARYYYGTDKSQLLLPPLDKYIGVSASIGKVIIGEGTGRNNTIWIVPTDMQARTLLFPWIAIAGVLTRVPRIIFI